MPGLQQGRKDPTSGNQRYASQRADELYITRTGRSRSYRHPKADTTLETLNADRVKLLPDPAGGSIESLVVTFAGVTSNNELSSQYSVRGGSYDENIVHANGLEVFRPLLDPFRTTGRVEFYQPGHDGSRQFLRRRIEARYGTR